MLATLGSATALQSVCHVVLLQNNLIIYHSFGYLIELLYKQHWARKGRLLQWHPSQAPINQSINHYSLSSLHR